MKKIIAAILLLVLLAAGGFYAKTEYDRWSAAQPQALGNGILTDLKAAFPEEDFQHGDLQQGVPKEDACTLTICIAQGEPAGSIVFRVKERNLLKKALYEVTEVKGTLCAEVINAEGASFAVHDGGFGCEEKHVQDPLFEGALHETQVSGLFSVSQIAAPEGYETCQAEGDRIFIMAPCSEAVSSALRSALSRELVLQKFRRKEVVEALSFAQPLLLSDNQAVVYAQVSSGKEGENASQEQICCLLEKDDAGAWRMTQSLQQEGAATLLSYAKETVWEIPEYFFPPQGRALEHPYYIMVNRQMNTVTVYEKDDEGNFTVPFKAMICSTGREGCETPIGDFSVMPFKAAWCLMIDSSYGQYATGFREGGYLFHSICYTVKDKGYVMADEYNMLGNFASAGCVRLQTVDAKWIFDNCETGTGVTVYDGPEPGPLGKPAKAVPELTDDNYNGWDPTDPDPANPWNDRN